MAKEGNPVFNMSTILVFCYPMAAGNEAQRNDRMMSRDRVTLRSRHFVPGRHSQNIIGEYHRRDGQAAKTGGV